MKFYFLDAGIGAEGLLWLAVIYLLGVTIVEWIVLLFFNLGNPGKMFLHSLLVNVASALLGYLLAEPIDSIAGKNDPNGLIAWLIFFVLTVIVEGFLLQVLNRQQPAKKVWLATITMNVVTYAALYFLTGHS